MAMLAMVVSATPASAVVTGTEGTFDVSFGVHGVAMLPLPFITPGSVNVDAQGRVVVSGFSVENGRSSLVVARYTSAGRLDPSFGVDGIARIGSRSVSDALVFGKSAIAPDGRIVVVGSHPAPLPHTFVARLNANGSLDTSFNGSGLATPQNGNAFAVEVDSTGRVVVIGADNEAVPFVWRFRADGRLDASFGTGGAARIGDAINTSDHFAVDASNRVVFDGVGTGGGNFVERITANGAPDSTFGTDGRTTNLGSLLDLRGIAVQGDGRIVVAGANNLRMGVTRLLTNGARDHSFGSSGTVLAAGLAAHTSSADVKVLPGGRLLVVGSGGNTTAGPGAFGVAVRLLADGRVDTNFACAGAAWSSLTNNDGGFQSVAVGASAAYVLSRGSTSASLAVQRVDLNSSGPNGYAIAAADGGSAAFGSAGPCASVDDLVLRQAVVGLATTPGGRGRWLVARDGGVFAAGDAQFFGSTGNLVLNRPIVGMAPTPSGHGYWLVASDGGVFSFGDARFFGSTGAMRLNRPVVGIAATHPGNGYWLVASDGGIFSFGDARFFGSTGAARLNRPVVGIAATHEGDGYWLVASDGGIFSFGNAPFRGSSVPDPMPTSVVGIASTP
jgi:uncharacterized delta-60 repeat protein